MKNFSSPIISFRKLTRISSSSWKRFVLMVPTGECVLLEGGGIGAAESLPKSWKLSYDTGSFRTQVRRKRKWKNE